MRESFGLVTILLVAACDGLGPEACTLDFVPGIIVTVVDSITDVPVADSAKGYVQEGSFVDSLAPSLARLDGTLLALEAAHERPGTYTVVVAHTGYEIWEAERVRVRDRGCHVETAWLTARLRSQIQ